MSAIVDHVKIYATNKIVEFPERLVYHDIKYANRLAEYVEKIADHVNLSDLEKEKVMLASWLFSASFGELESVVTDEGVISNNAEAVAIKNAKEFFSKYPYPHSDEIILMLDRFVIPKVPVTLNEKVLSDAVTVDFVMGKPKKKMKRLYEELVLSGLPISKKDWFDYALEVSQNATFYTEYCIHETKPKLDEFKELLIKEKKEVKKQRDLALKMEMNISEEELKNLKKKLKSSKGRDDRGIQTMFRTTIKNHYTLNEMVDRKASIMITVNSIILSLVLGGVIGEIQSHGHAHFDVETIAIILLSLTCIASIFYAIISIIPNKTHGEFSVEEIRKKKGNLLYFGNFHNVPYDQFEWGFLEMIADQNFLYDSMIRDLYFLGQVLNRKYKQIRKSLNIFLYGLVFTVSLVIIGRLYTLLF